MGQKINPLIFRSKIFPIYTNSYNTYSTTKLNLVKYLNFKKSLIQDFKNINVLDIVFKNNYKNKCMFSIILVSKNQYYNNKKYINTILFKYNKILFIRIQILKQPLLSAKFILNYIIEQYKLKKISIRKLIKQIVCLILNKYKIKGIKFLISGRINGVQMAKTEVFKFNEISLQKLNFYVNYSNNYITTKSGVIGFKLWLFF